MLCWRVRLFNACWSLAPRWGRTLYCSPCLKKSDWYERSVAKAEKEYNRLEDNCHDVVVTANFGRKRVVDDQTRLQQTPQSEIISSMPPGISSSNSTISAAGSSNSSQGMEEEVDALKRLLKELTLRISVLEEKPLELWATRITNLESVTSRALTDRITSINRHIHGRVDIVEDRLSLLENQLSQEAIVQEDVDICADCYFAGV